jgi:glycosyltransferase involved in cell wall biosynthesis
MKLMILNDSHVFRKGGHLWSLDPWLKLAGHLEPFFSSILLCVPLGKEAQGLAATPLTEGWDGKRISWIHTYAHESVINYYKLLPFVVAQNFPIIFRAVRESDVVFLRLPAMNGFLATVAAQLLGKPFVCYFGGDQKIQILEGGKYSGVWALPARLAAALHDALYRQVVRKSNASLFLSETTLARLDWTGTDCMFMFPSMIEERKIWMRPTCCQGSTRRRLLFVGALETAKGIKYLLEAMVRLIRTSGEYTLNICGDGPERQALEQLTDRLGLRSVVHFSGHIRWGEELIRIYRDSDILVHPSLSEGVPKVVLEAMANGVAVIATTVGGIPRIVTHEENGLLVSPAAPAAIADAVTRLVQDKELENHLVQGGYNFIRRHTAEKQARKIATIICGAVEKAKIDYGRIHGTSRS